MKAVNWYWSGKIWIKVTERDLDKNSNLKWK